MVHSSAKNDGVYGFHIKNDDFIPTMIDFILKMMDFIRNNDGFHTKQ